MTSLEENRFDDGKVYTVAPTSLDRVNLSSGTSFASVGWFEDGKVYSDAPTSLGGANLSSGTSPPCFDVGRATSLGNDVAAKSARLTAVGFQSSANVELPRLIQHVLSGLSNHG